MAKCRYVLKCQAIMRRRVGSVTRNPRGLRGQPPWKRRRVEETVRKSWLIGDPGAHQAIALGESGRDGGRAAADVSATET